MIKLPLKFLGYTITFQEVPNEVSLVFNISGCPHKCEGCHSQYLWEYNGELLCNEFNNIIEKYKNMITCVCFMGGDQNIKELSKYLEISKNKYKLKTCIYSGLDLYDIFTPYLGYIDYLKIGHYSEKYGGLKDANTNQIFYKIINKKLINTTYIFQRNKNYTIRSN